MTIIVDGTGKGYEAKVDSTNRLYTRSVSISEQAQFSIDGKGYNLNTGDISITANTESAYAYFKYTGTTKFHIDALAIGAGRVSSSSDVMRITMVRNPDTGTIIDNAVTGAMNANRNFGSTAVLSGDWYKGVTGDTISGGSDIAQFYQGQGTRLFATIDFILEPSNTIGMKILPNTSDTFNIYIAFIGHEEET